MWILAAPLVVVALLIIAFILLFFKCWKTAILFCSLAIGLNTYIEWFPVHLLNRGMPDEKGQFTLLTCNVKLGDDKDVFKYLDTMNVDLMFLQETAQMKDTNVLAKHYPYRAGETVLSKYPITNYYRYKMDRKDPRYDMLVDSVRNIGNEIQNWPFIFSMDIDMPQGKVRVINVHLRSNAYSTARRAMKEGTPWIDGIEEYYNYTKYGYMVRGVQADMIRNELDSLSQDMPTLVVGDFNDINGSYAVERIKGDRLKDAWWTNGFGLGTTYDSWHLKLRLDHILYSKEFEIQDIMVLNDFRHSDHLPVRAMVRWK